MLRCKCVRRSTIKLIYLSITNERQGASNKLQPNSIPSTGHLTAALDWPLITSTFTPFIKEGRREDGHRQQQHYS